MRVRQLCQTQEMGSGSTPAALEKYEVRTAALKAAKNPAERQAIADGNPIIQTSFSFKGDEAEIIRKALGTTPAAKILDLCTEVGKNGKKQ